MKNRYAILSTVVACGLLASSALAQDKTAAKPAPKGQPDKAAATGGMDPKMMEAFEKAGKPGPMHEHMTKSAGTWEGKVKMWMPGMDAMESTCTTVITPMFDGRYCKIESNGDMGPMGPFHGFGLYGFDNVSQKFQSVWIDNMGTGMMSGTGELTADGKTLNWTCTMNDPVTGKPTTCRQVDHYDGENAMRLEMFGQGPDGKEYRAMEITYTRTGGAKPADAGKAASHAPDLDKAKKAADAVKSVDPTRAPKK